MAEPVKVRRLTDEEGRKLQRLVRRGEGKAGVVRYLEGTVYACDGCGERALGEQYCADCQTFIRSLGRGGLCPTCDSAVAIKDLLEGGWLLARHAAPSAKAPKPAAQRLGRPNCGWRKAQRPGPRSTSR